MKKIIFIVCTAILLVACSSTKRTNSIIGQFRGTTYWMGKSMDLSLLQSGIFYLNWVDKDYTGTWSVVAKGQVLLKFDKITDMSNLLGAGSLNGNDIVIYFLNNNKIRVDGNVLKRIK